MAQTIIEKLINLLWLFGPAALVLGFLIFIHELGHFIAARLVGIRVEVFSIGFGKRLFGFRKGATDYRVSAIPFGGYVRMAGEELPGQGKAETTAPPDPGTVQMPGTASMEIPKSDSVAPARNGDTLNEKSVPQRILVAVAGAFMNAIVAVILTIGLAYFGINIDAYLLQKPVIAHIQSGSPAEKSGLMPGDLITQINDVDVETWEDAQIRILMAASSKASVTYIRSGLETTTDLKLEDTDKFPFGGIGTPSKIIVGNVSKDSAAESAGLKSDDHIILINGQTLSSIFQLIDTINQSGGESVELTVRREETLQSIQLKPVFNEESKRYMIGISFAQDPDQVLRRYPAGESIVKGVELNLQMSAAMFGLVGKLIMGRESVDQLGGPVMIVDMAGKAARAGTRELIWLTALISLNLAILNLLPVPILDGGMVVFLIVEGIIRRPVGEKIQLALQNVFFILLISFALYVTYNDVIRLMFK